MRSREGGFRTKEWSGLGLILDGPNPARSLLWNCETVMVHLTRTQVDISHPWFLTKYIEKNVYTMTNKTCIYNLKKHVSLRVRRALLIQESKRLLIIFYYVVIAMIVRMYDCHLQMVVISVPASGDDNPMLTLCDELPRFVTHLIDISPAGVSNLFLETRQFGLWRKAHEVCWNVAFYILNTIFGFDLHVHWQKAITHNKNDWGATGVITCWLTASFQQTPDGVCVTWVGNSLVGFVESSPLFMDIKVHFLVCKTGCGTKLKKKVNV